MEPNDAMKEDRRGFLWLEVLIAAQRLGVADALEEQLQQSQAERFKWALGKKTSENRDRARAGKEVVRLLAEERSTS